MKYEFNHLALVVADCERSADYYSEVLGCSVIHRTANEALKIILLQSGPLNIELLQFISAPSSPRGNGLYDHIAFHVPDLEAAMAHLKSKDIKFETDSPRQGMNGKKIIFFSGPDGERIELIEK